ncbi:MAG: hypothetical protein AAB152_14490 [Candidatus Coatesbacteria bacterium]
MIPLLAALLLACPGAPAAEVVWWEGEAPSETNFPAQTSFSSSTFPDHRSLLSGGDWLTNEGPRTGGEAFARYPVRIAEGGRLELWCRKFWKHGPFRWRIDTGPWRTCSQDVALADTTPIRRFLCANWVSLGPVELGAGDHVFELRLLAGPGEPLTAAFDCFALVSGPFFPRGRLRLGEKSGEADAGFFPWEPDADRFGKDAVLDLRGLNEATAGAKGFVRREGERFRLGDGKPVRFWGVNVGGELAGLPHPLVDYLARRLAKTGVNMVRFQGALWRDDDPAAVDPRKLDDLHYLVAACKREGIYLSLSTWFPLWLTATPALGLPGYETTENKRPFALIYFDPAMQALHRGWIDGMLKPRNPYTGLPLAKEPAVAILELVNEDSFFFWTFGRANIPPVQWTKLQKAFAVWVEARYRTLALGTANWLEAREPDDSLAEGRLDLYDAWHMTADGIKAAGPGKRKRVSDQVRFLAETQRAFYASTIARLRGKLGVRCLIEASNWTVSDPAQLDALERWTYAPGDLIDRHGYFEASHEGEGASYSVEAGHTFANKAAVRSPDDLPLAFVQTAGFPNTISEIGWTNPNRWRADFAFLASAYGSLQGLAGLDAFAAGSPGWDGAMGKFGLTVPVIMANFPAYALAYRRGDIRTGPSVLAQTVVVDDLFALAGNGGFAPVLQDPTRVKDVPSKTSGTPSTIDPLACYVGRVTRGFGLTRTETAMDLGPFLDRPNRMVRSATGELAWDWGKGIVRLDTPRIQGAAGFLSQSARIDLSTLSIECEHEYATVCAISLDGRPLAESRRILVQAMTVERPLGFKASGGLDGRIDDVGRYPMGVELIRATVTLRLTGGGVPVVTALDEHGYRREGVPVQGGLDGAPATFRLDAKAVYHVLER